MRIQYFLLLTFLLALPFAGHSQEAIRLAIESRITDFRLGEAEQLINNLTSPSHQAFYRSRILFYKNISTDDPQYLDPFLQHSKSGIQLFDKKNLDEKSQTMLSEMYLQRGVMRFLKKNYVRAASDLSKACDLASACERKYPNSPEPKKLLGIYNLALSAVPRKWQWLSGWLCFKGDASTGISQLTSNANSNGLLPMESEAILFFYEKNFVSEPEKALKRIEPLVNDQPESLLFNLFLASAWLDNGNTAAAVNILEKGDRFRNDPEVFWSPIWDLYLGRAKMYTESYLESAVALQKFLDSYEGNAYRSDALYRKAICQELVGRRKKSSQSFSSILNSNLSGFDADDYAAKMSAIYAARPMTEFEKELYRARNLSDGGAFEKSNNLLLTMVDSLSAMTEDERTELYYRFGRNYDKQGKKGLAKFYYLACTGTAPFQNLWMKVYAHFYLGKIRSAEGNPSSAIKEFESALKFEGYFYQEGLERMGRSALKKARKQTSITHSK